MNIHSINGVKGELSGVVAAPATTGTFSKQSWKSEARNVSGYGVGAKLTVKIRFDDQRKNGKNSFSITGEVVSGFGKLLVGGCVHDIIAKVFPELAPLIKWHLADSSGPMHYLSNALHHATNRCDSRFEPGTPTHWRTFVKFCNSPALHDLKDKFATWAKEQVLVGTFWTVETIPYVNTSGSNYDFAPQYTFTGYSVEWHSCPFTNKTEAEAFAEAMNTGLVEFVEVPTTFAKGKKRDLAAARRCAVWPEATDEQLSAPDLKEQLEARLPLLVAEFKAAVLAAGLAWEAPQVG